MVDRATFDHLMPKTRRRLARSPYAPIDLGETFRTETLARLLADRLKLGTMSEREAVDVLEARAAGRSVDIITWAQLAGLIRRVDVAGEPVMLEAARCSRKTAAYTSSHTATSEG